MSKILAVFRKEIRVYFTTPVAYVAFFMFTIVFGFVFLRVLADFQNQIFHATQFNPQALQYLNFTDGVLIRLLFEAAFVMILVIPLITMRLLAEERRARTFELLSTCPVTPLQIIAGKYLAALVVVAVMSALVLVYPALVTAYAEVGGPDWATVLVGILGLFLVGAAFTAVGMFISSLTRSQIVAGVITLCSLLLFWVAGSAASDNTGLTRDVLYAIGASGHFAGFANGIIDIKDLVYFLSLVFLGMFLTYRALEAQRWQ